MIFVIYKSYHCKNEHNQDKTDVFDITLPVVSLIGLDVRKPVSGGLRTTKAQTSLRIRAVCSAPLLFANLKVSYINLLQA